MNKKLIYFIVILAIIFFILNLILDDNSYNFESELSNGEYDGLRFITSTKNLCVIIARFLDRVCEFVVDGIFLILEKGLGLIFGF